MSTENQPWTDEQVAQMLDYWSRDLSAGAIAPLVGKTRSSVMSKLFRMGVLKRPRSQAKDLVAARKAVAPSARDAESMRHNSWSEERLTEKWADRKERLRRERAQQAA